eukprot:163093-Chlamydomonas_euryale.AAC.1
MNDDTGAVPMANWWTGLPGASPPAAAATSSGIRCSSRGWLCRPPGAAAHLASASPRAPADGSAHTSTSHLSNCCQHAHTHARHTLVLAASTHTRTHAGTHTHARTH